MSRRNSRSRHFLVLIFLLALTASGCATTPAEDDPFTRRAGEGDNVRLTIDNRNFRDATIYVHWRGATRIRTGRVSGNSRETFEITYRAGDLQVEADFLAGESTMSRTVNVNRGDHLELILR